MNRVLPLLALSLSCTRAATPDAPMPSTPRRGVELGDLDRKANPCDDFFAFSNGAWRAQHPIPASMDRWSRRWQAGEENKEKLKLILDELTVRTDWKKGSVEQLVGDFNAACMDEGRAEAAGLTPLAPMLLEIESLETQAEVQREIRKLEALGIGAPFNLSSTPDQHQPARTIAQISAGGLGLPDRDYYSKPEPRFAEAREKYQAHLRKMFELARMKDAEQRAQVVFAFEKRLADASLDNVALRDPKNTDHLVKFEEVAKFAPHFDWAALFDDGKVARGDANVDEPKFMAAFDEELTKSPVPAWRAYLAWQLLNASAPWLSKPFVDEAFDFDQRYLSGVAEMKPRGVRCAELTDELLGEALGRKYVERYFPPAAKARMQELVRNELEAMKEIVQGLTWMGPETRKRALHKIETFNPKIGYPDKWKDYSPVEVRRDQLFANIVNGRHFAVADFRSRIGKPTDRGLWGMTPPTSNAYYNPLLNEVVFPAGILRPPAFDANAVDAVNYGAIGVVIGHEISHGFDDQGAQYDADGRLNDWWTSEDLARFHERTQCVADQFEGYFIEPGLHHNGKLVLGESIGDLAGARVAYLAYQKALQQHPEAQHDGFTNEQEFFVAWGQFRGDEIRPATQRRMIQGDPHPVAKFRVIGPLSNLTEFQSAFQCAAGSAMVRPKRCEVW